MPFFPLKIVLKALNEAGILNIFFLGIECSKRLSINEKDMTTYDIKMRNTNQILQGQGELSIPLCYMQ